MDLSPIHTGLKLPDDLQSFVIITEVVCDLNPVQIGHVCNMQSKNSLQMTYHISPNTEELW